MADFAVASITKQTNQNKTKSRVGGGVKITQTFTLAIQPRQDQGWVPGHQWRRTAGCSQAEMLLLHPLEVWLKKHRPHPRCWATALGSPHSPSCPCPSPLQVPETLLQRGLGWLRTLLKDRLVRSDPWGVAEGGKGLSPGRGWLWRCSPQGCWAVL